MIKTNKIHETGNIYLIELPHEIILELNEWNQACNNIKSHPLSYLKLHENTSTEHNGYQISVPKHLVEKSFWLPLVLRSCSKVYGGYHRDYSLRKWESHFDFYDVWLNYSYKGNKQPYHTHEGSVSGIIYLKNNNEQPTIFKDINFNYAGKSGEMIIFPSQLGHEVSEKTTEDERITIAFNIIKKGKI